MIDLDFSKIRSFDGSQDNGFEELICQLAHLKKPENASYFVRKEGAGGDAGVECYWKLHDGSEHAWQAKYFPDRMEDDQWSQISKSVTTALEKHPKLTKYYVCLPRDWTDSRKLSKSGKLVQSAWVKWEEHVKKWNLKAKAKGMDVEFLYWCKHEISLMLQTDDSHFAGRSLYWFNEPVIHPQLLNKLALNSREALGERFTPENHVHLSISAQFDGLGLSPEWNNRLMENRSIIENILKKLDMDFFSNRNFPKNEVFWTELYEELEKMSNELLISLERDFTNFNNIKENYSKLESIFKKCSSSIYSILEKEQGKELKNQWREFNNKFQQIENKFVEMKSFLFGKAAQAMTSKAAVLLGEAGIGKSHLLCDLTLKRLENSLPTLFLLGQQYSGGNPFNFILDQLDIRGGSYKQVLGALDAAGEAKKTRTLIIIDAINEGNHKDEWIHHLSPLLAEISNYPHLSILLSCRSTYANYIIPELSEHRLTRINHTGFKGYEHRAAMIYLANQGISKPSAPITLPEFSNPLFLKTCCKALKVNGYTSFPKGLHGQSKLFDFYLDSVEKIINRKKKYISGQMVVKNALNEFVESLYPNNLFGITVSEALMKINKHDTNPQSDDSLTSLLIDEGLLSLDIIPEPNGRGVEVLRFTYERFSDHFIAQYIIDQINKNEIEICFVDEGLINELIKNGPNKSGIIEALGLGFPEKLQREFIDFIDEDSFNYDWLFSSSFTDVIQWRAIDSFTDRTVELLNMIPSYGVHKESIDKLLMLSTEPAHPWNADFLNKNLQRMKLVERDAFWSTHVAVSDWEENEENSESIVRTIIDWSLKANLNEVETERLRLTAITLLWLTTTTNRRVRDQSTKSLARILSYSPQLVEYLITNYNSCDDPYLVERLYAAIYGAVCAINNEKIIKEIAMCVFANVFENRKPYPHILMRDYARGVLELAFNKGLFLSDINPEVFRPPYSSDWPIENPSKKDIEKLVVNELSSAIKNSVIGYLGDFGKYSMGCVHDWSPTPLAEEKPESSYEIHLKFAKTLPEELKDRYIKHINKQIEKNMNEQFNLKEFLESLKVNENNFEDNKIKMEDDWEVLKEDVKASLDENHLEYFRWVSGLGINERPAKFSRKWAQRWVCKRAYELGWESNLFADFERLYLKNNDRSSSRVERIGKKYQWIAFHELLAIMSDNLYWVDRGYSDVDDSKYWGPWQIHLRDLDPTMWLRETGDSGWDEFSNIWWQPFNFPFVDDNLQHQKSWLWDKTNIPSFKELIIRTNPIDNKKWTVLRGFAKGSKKAEKDENNIPGQDAWFRINTCIVHKNDVNTLINELKGKNLCDPDISKPKSTGHQGFIKEYPWHPCYEEMIDWNQPNSNDNWRELINVKFLVPTNEYDWESGSTDKSIKKSISLYLPNKYLLSELDLKLKKNEFGEWVDGKGNLAFIDPSAKNTGPSFALINSELLNDWLEENNFQLIWLIGGEKQLFTSMASKFFGRLVYSGIFTHIDNRIDGEMWFIEEPNDRLEE
ncbi:NACHT domain-containing protein [Gottfriedia acidiceleris]|uniref:NACHT domain-containing protein n=1 Tax=Gottfriedia acidiceleris TaxID=371036 RepID=UPI003D25CB69